ncbi:MAG: hypothetical protein K2N78_12745 [Oscillospiraceae bacterium]|nr:hypothetical protein [Oscillospiraceae bacterium]
MSIVTLRFFMFVGVTAVLYWLCPSRWRWIVLLAASGAFMLAGSSPALCCVFAAETLLVWLAALRLRKASGERVRTAVTAGTVVLLAAVLIAYKDIAFFVHNINGLGRLAGIDIGLRMPEWAAPVGVSYYTLILIGYLLDVRWEKIGEPQRNPLKMLLFAGYFPQLTSGPFSRYGDVAETLFGGARWSLRGVQFGLQRMFWGLFKKLVLADRLAVLVGALYSGGGRTGTLVLAGAVLFAAQMYADFSGCMDIVLGVSEILGVPLAENFCRPFAAADLSEIWRRWHITLGLWLKDYILYPTLKSGWMQKVRKFCKKHWGKRASREIPTYIGMFITWFCVGFWHGGSWKYIFGSGLFFFGMIAGGMLLDPVFKKIISLMRIDTGTWSWSLFQRVRSFCLFAAAVSFDRRESFMAGLRAWKTVFTDWNPWVLFDGTLMRLGLDGKDIAVCAFALGAMLVVSMLQERLGSVREVLARQNLVFRWLVYIALVLAVVVLGRYGPGYDAAAFIYAGF